MWHRAFDNSVQADTFNKLKSHLDNFWQYRDNVYDYKVEIHGTGSQNLHH